MSARGLKILVEEFLPSDMKDKLNGNSWFQGAVLLLLLLIGPLLIKVGVKGIKEKRVVSKGREYTGTAAIVVSSLWILSGLILIGGALLAGLQAFVFSKAD